jgi:hypothetical protein
MTSAPCEWNISTRYVKAGAMAMSTSMSGDIIRINIELIKIKIRTPMPVKNRQTRLIVKPIFPGMKSMDSAISIKAPGMMNKAPGIDARRRSSGYHWP